MTENSHHHFITFMSSLGQELGHREGGSSLLQDVWDLNWGDPMAGAGRAGAGESASQVISFLACVVQAGQALLGLSTAGLQVAPSVRQPRSNQTSCTVAQDCKNECFL